MICPLPPIPGRRALFVVGEERRRVEPRPQGIALGAQCLHGVEVRAQLQAAAIGGAEPARQRLQGARRQGQHRVPPKASVGFGVIRVRRITGDADQHRGNTQSQRDVAGGGALTLNEIHIFWAHRHGAPVEAAFQQHRPAGVARALKAGFQLRFQPPILFRRQLTVAGIVDQRARRQRGVVQHRLVPGAGRIVDIDRRGRGFNGGHTVIVIGWVEQRHVLDLAYARHGVAREADGMSVDGVVVGGWPAIRTRYYTHAVRAQHMELSDIGADGNRLQIGIARNQQEAVPGLQQIRLALQRVGLAQQIKQRVIVDLLVAGKQRERNSGRRLGDHAYTPVDHRVLHEAFTRECRIIARAPDRLTLVLQRDDGAGGAHLGFGWKNGGHGGTKAGSTRQAGEEGGHGGDPLWGGAEPFGEAHHGQICIA